MTALTNSQTKSEILLELRVKTIVKIRGVPRGGGLYCGHKECTEPRIVPSSPIFKKFFESLVLGGKTAKTTRDLLFTQYYRNIHVRNMQWILTWD